MEEDYDELPASRVKPGKWGRSRGSKALVVIAAQADGKGIGRIRMRQIADASSDSLLPFVQETIDPESTVITDGWEAYEGLKNLRYKHKARIIMSMKSGRTRADPR